MRKSVSAVLLSAVFVLSTIMVSAQAAREATIEPETKARIVLQSQLNSKLMGGGAATAGAGIAGGLLGGLLLTKGGDVRVAPGAVFRIKFVKPLTLPVVQQGGASPRPIQQDSDSPSIKKNP